MKFQSWSKICREFSLLVACLVFLLPQIAKAQVTKPALQEVREIIQLQFETNGAMRIAGRDIQTGKLALFYQKRDYTPIWINRKGVIPEADSLFEAITGAGRQGLVPADYHLEALLERLAQTTAARQAELDILLTDAFLRYCLDVRSGRADPRNADPEWFVLIDRIDHLAALEQALATESFRSVLNALPPREPAYHRLLAALAEYRRLARSGGWPVLNTGKTLHAGDTDEAVPALRERLRIGGDLGAGPASKEFDLALAEAVRTFQKRHGLKPDGIVGPRTRAALNLPIEERIRQILLNIERWRWMPRDLPERYLLVNMAGFDLKAVENHRSILRMRVIVGRDYRQTPAFSEPIRYLVLNPFWNIPPSIAIKDILPQVREDPTYLRREGIRVFRDWSAGAPELEPAAIDWASLGPNRFPYKLRQDPGPRNALGRIKFMLPNTFNVYLHDTPHRELFDHTVRTFSSGCIRLEKPLRLAEYLLSDEPGWSRKHLKIAIDRGQRQVVSLDEPHPVFLVYWTAWVDEDGTVQFRDDVYRRDASLRQALHQGP